jgi:hypothetical protein
MERHVRGVLVVACIVVFAAAIGVGWLALGPTIMKACPLPVFQPGAGWTRIEEHVGGFNGAGNIRGSSVVWRNTDGTRTFVIARLATGVEGDLPHAAATVRGQPAAIYERRGEDGSDAGYDVYWQDGILGCTVALATLTGGGVTLDEAVAAADALR